MEPQFPIPGIVLQDITLDCLRFIALGSSPTGLWLAKSWQSPFLMMREVCHCQGTWKRVVSTEGLGLSLAQPFSAHYSAFVVDI